MPSPNSRTRLAICPTIAILLLPVLGIPIDGNAYVDGAPPAHTGGFEEPTCASCHLGNPVNDSAGSLELSAPDVIVPGEQYLVEIRLRHPELERGGFQLSARFAAGPGSGDQAGLLIPGPGIEIVEEDGVQYARHSRAGVESPESHEIAWRFRWEAPAAVDSPVVFHVAANAANYDDSEFGDFVYRGAEEAEPIPPEKRKRFAGGPRSPASRLFPSRLSVSGRSSFWSGRTVSSLARDQARLGDSL